MSPLALITGLTVFAQSVLTTMGLTPKAAQLAARSSRVVSLDVSEVIYQAGAKVAYWDFVISGAVGASLSKSSAQSSLVHFYIEGSWFGEHNIINEDLAAFEYSALTSVEILRLPGQIFLDLISSEPEFAQQILRRTSWTHQKHLDHLSLLKNGASSSRAFYGLAMCLEFFSRPRARAPGVSPRSSQLIPLKQELLAQFCGVSRTVMSRELQRLSSIGLVRIDYSEIELMQLHVWQVVLNDLNRQLHDVKNLNDPISQIARNPLRQV